jgi:hypothetical protein
VADAPMNTALGPRPSEALDFLQWLHPGEPWTLTAIVPDGDTKTETFTSEAAAADFIRRHNADRNVYYQVNPTKRALSNKASKADIAAAEFVFADLDPRDAEMPEQAKARYLGLLQTFSTPPSAIIDSGNGVQALWRLAQPVDLARRDEVEVRTKALILALGGTSGTQNIDRILRVPGTINWPNAKKRKAGRVACMATTIKLNGAAWPLEAFPAAATSAESGGVRKATSSEPKSSEIPTALRNLLHVQGSGGHPSRSELLFKFIIGALRAKVPDDVIIAECLVIRPGCSIYEHCEENGGRNYIERQIERARAKSQTNSPHSPNPPQSIRLICGRTSIRHHCRADCCRR